MDNLELQELATQIVDNVKEQWLDEAKVIVEYDDYQKWLAIEDAPNIDELVENEIEDAKKENGLTLDENEELKDLVYYELPTEQEFEELAFDNWRD